jgi:type IX secretion system PorP/SprF family membrane protein
MHHLKFSFFKKSVVLLGILILVQTTLNAQDVSYSQYLSTPMYYNPAYAGLLPGMRTRLNQRNQWSGMLNNYNNYSFAMDVAEPNIPGAGGIGLIVQSDLNGMGNIRTNSATLASSARVMISRNMVTQFGISVAYVQRSVDWNSFVFSDQLDPQHGMVRESDFVAPDYDQVSYPDFGFGLLLQYHESSRYFNYMVGTISASVQHAFRPNISFTGTAAQLPLKLVMMGDVLLDNENGSIRFKATNEYFFKLNPGFLFEKQGELTNFVLGTNAYRNYIYAGLWLRSQSFTYANVNDLICVVGFHLPMSSSSRIKFMYSYDYVLSEMRSSIGSTHEFSVVFELDGFSIFGGTNMTERRRLGRGTHNMGYPENPAF